MSCNSERKPMYIVSFKAGEQTSFKLIPFTKESKFVECVYDPSREILHVASGDKYKTFNMIPKVNKTGERIYAGYKTNENGEKIDVYEQERVEIETFYEFEIVDKAEIIAFVREVSHNYDEAYVLSFIYPNKTTKKKTTKKVAEAKKD